jgi:GAF domain-containing protein
MTVERPQTASRAKRAGSSSPYNALPGSALALGLQTRPKTANVAAPGEDSSARSIYVRAPRPPGALREYVPLRPRAHSARHQRTWQQDWDGIDDASQPHDDVQPAGRPMSARIAVGPSNWAKKPPPVSARGRMQSDYKRTLWDGGPVLARQPCSAGQESNYESIHEDDDAEHGDVAIFPAPNKPGFIPPQPLLQDPSPRRRPMSAQVSSMSKMPSIAEPSDAVARHLEDDAGVAARARSALLKDLGPVMSAIASLTHETSLNKLARQIDAVVLMLLEADASRLVIYDDQSQVLQVVRPGDHDHHTHGPPDNEFKAEGITGFCAQSGGPINVTDLRESDQVALDVDLGLDKLPNMRQVPYLAVPARDKAGNVIAVISAMRMGLKTKPFEEEDLHMMEMIALQAGVAVSLCMQREDAHRTKIHNKVLVKAAVQLTSAPDLDAGSLTLMASVYAKKIVDCDSVVVCLSHDHHRHLRNWTIVSGETHDRQDATILAGDVRLEEHSHIQVPVVLKKVVTTGSVTNVLLQGRPHRGDMSDLKFFDDPELKTVSVIQGKTLEYNQQSDSCLAVPLQVEPGAEVMGVIVAMNKFGGPRKAGKAGIFGMIDEEALRELANIASSALAKIMRVADLETAIALAPALTHHNQAHSALSELCKTAAKPLKADKLLFFTLEEDGCYQLHQSAQTGERQILTKQSKSQRGNMHNPMNSPQAMVRLSANSYPLKAAADSRGALRVNVHDTSEVILNRRNGLLTHATDMLACPVRDREGNLYGVMLLAMLKNELFPEHCLRLANDVSAQMGAVLRKCEQFKQQSDHVHALQHAGKEMLNIVNKRELTNVIDHVDSQVSSFMCCSRAVLYIVDRAQHVVWTVVKTENDQESIVVYEIKDNVDPKAEGSRVGYVNAALHEGKVVTVKDFAYGQHAYNDMLDSADLKHVQKLLKIQSGAYDTATTAAMRAELEPEQRTESIAATPLRDVNGEIIAVLQVMNRWKSQRVKRVRKEGFDKDDLDKLELVAAAVSSTLETSARLNRQWEREHELRSIIDSANDGIKIGMGATCRVNLSDALSYVAKSAHNKCGATQVAVYLLDEEGQMDVIRFEGNLFVPCKRVKAAIEGIAGETIKQGKRLNIIDAHQHPAFKASVDEKDMLPVTSVLSCPIKDPNGKVVGALVFQNKKSERNRAGYNDTDPFRAHGTHSARKAVMAQVRMHAS